MMTRETGAPGWAVVSAITAAGAALGWLFNMSQVAHGVGWGLAAATAAVSAAMVKPVLGRLGFAMAASLTAYMAWVALGPLGAGEFDYMFTALRMSPVIAVVYVLAFVWARRDTRVGRQQL